MRDNTIILVYVEGSDGSDMMLRAWVSLGYRVMDNQVISRWEGEDGSIEIDKEESTNLIEGTELIDRYNDIREGMIDMIDEMIDNYKQKDHKVTSLRVVLSYPLNKADLYAGVFKILDIDTKSHDIGYFSSILKGVLKPFE